MGPKEKIPDTPKEPDSLTGPEMDVVTVVFHQFETGLREGTIYTRDILDALKALGLNPGEQEVIDITNEVATNGLVYFPDFCKIVLRKFREENEELFNQQLFKVLCGTDPYPQNFRAKRYRISEKSFSKEEFCMVMRQLPVQEPHKQKPYPDPTKSSHPANTTHPPTSIAGLNNKAPPANGTNTQGPQPPNSVAAGQQPLQPQTVTTAVIATSTAATTVVTLANESQPNVTVVK